MWKERTFCCNLSKGQGIFTCSSRSAHVLETSSSTSTSQTEPDYYTECGQPIYVQSHMLSNHVHKIIENFREVQTTVRIPNQTPLQGSQSKGIA